MRNDYCKAGSVLLPMVHETRDAIYEQGSSHRMYSDLIPCTDVIVNVPLTRFEQ